MLLSLSKIHSIDPALLTETIRQRLADYYEQAMWELNPRTYANPDGTHSHLTMESLREAQERLLQPFYLHGSYDPSSDVMRYAGIPQRIEGERHGSQGLTEPPTVACDFCGRLVPAADAWVSARHTACDPCFRARKAEQLAKEKLDIAASGVPSSSRPLHATRR